MDKSGFVLIDMYSRIYQPLAEAPCHTEYELFVGNMRNNNPNIHASEGGIFNAQTQVVIDDYVRRRHIYIASGTAQYILKDTFSNSAPIKRMRAVAERDHITFFFNCTLWRE